MDNSKNQSQSYVNQQMPRRKNALGYEESLAMEREKDQEIEIANKNNVNNQLMITSFSQLNLNDKIVKK
jgi:hypothetical protein